MGGGEGRVGECHGVNALFSPLAWKLTFSIKSIAHRRGALFSRRPPICIRFPFSLLVKKIQAGYQSNSDPRNFHVLHSHCAFPCQSNCGTAGCGQDTRASIIVHVGVCVIRLHIQWLKSIPTLGTILVLVNCSWITMIQASECELKTTDLPSCVSTLTRSVLWDWNTMKKSQLGVFSVGS